jgi:hypothetical protein
MELATVQNYLAASVNLDGVRPEVVKKAFAGDIATELMHAQQLAVQIQRMGETVPGSMEPKRDQGFLQPLKDTTDVMRVIKGVIEAENSANTKRPEAPMDYENRLPASSLGGGVLRQHC